jgi:nitrogenase molybdenum-iron protein beta chain
MQSHLAGSFLGGRVSGSSVPATGVIEKQIIFGGGSRLREQLKNTVKAVEGKLYIVLNGCEAAMVGDDIVGMTREAAEQREAAVCCEAAGFHGDAHYGYERVMYDLIAGIASLEKIFDRPKAEKSQKKVNVFGILPPTDAHFRGDLMEVRRLLKGIGAGAGIFFGPGNGVEELAAAPDADLNLIFSKWGVSIGERLEETYGTPKLVFPTIPTGYEPVRGMMRAIVEKLSLDEKRADAFLKEEELRLRYHLRGIWDERHEEFTGNKTVAVVGDESVVIKIGDFLSRYLGVEVSVAIVTDNFTKAPKFEGFGKKPEEVAKNVWRTQDTGEIRDILTRGGADVILGSWLENTVAKTLNASNLEVSCPVRGRIILSKTYSGIQGASQLAEDYLSVALESGQMKRKRLIVKGISPTFD